VKNLIIYGVIFLLAFALVTGALFFLNSQYKNIFAHLKHISRQKKIKNRWM